MPDIFDFVARRPPKAAETRLEPHSFDFDHLRLYMRWRDVDNLPPSEFSKLTFEVQIKTYLQHAWALATHDLTYKTDDVNWTKARIAYQVKAMLDHAEASIAHAGEWGSAAGPQISSPQFDEIRTVIALIKQTWTDQATLPADIRRLAETVLNLIHGLNITAAELKADLEAETAEGRGLLVQTLSPFGVIVHAMLQRRQNAMKRLMTGASRHGNRNYKVVIPAEISLPMGIARDECTNAVFVG
jgi:Region found in RelA / SpoT proteins